MTDRPRIAQREPRSLQPEQMGQLTVSTPAVPQRVHAWVLWEDGVEELMETQATAWTKRAVRSGSVHRRINTRSGSGPEQWSGPRSATWRAGYAAPAI